MFSSPNPPPGRHRKRAILALVAALSVPATTARAILTCETLEGHIEVRLIEGTHIEEIEEASGTSVVDSLPPSYLLRVEDGAPIDSVVVTLLENEFVASARAALLLESPEAARQMVVAAVGGTSNEFETQHHLHRLQTTDVHAVTRGAGQLIAIIDTGVMQSHEVLGERLVPGRDFVDDDDDPSETRNGVDDDEDGAIDEGAGHGTLVTGLAAVVAPDARLMPLRVLDDEGRGLVFHVAQAVRHAVDSGAGVINLSLGLYCVSEVLEEELRNAWERNVVVVAAAGNEDRELPALHPAVSPYTLSITSVDGDDVKADFANYHSSVDVSAPGTELLGPYDDGGYAIGSGTSFSAPIASGLVALIKAHDDGVVDSDIGQRLRSGVTNVDGNAGNELYQQKLGTGRVHGQILAAILSGLVQVGGAPRHPGALTLFPNPVASGHTLVIELSDPTVDRIGIWDVAGRLVTHIAVTNGTALWGSRDASRRIAGPGVYFIAPRHGPGSARRVVLN